LSRSFAIVLIREKEISMTSGVYNLEVHNPAVAHESFLFGFVGLTGARAAALMEQHAYKALVLRERGKPTAADHRALWDYQVRNGKRLMRF
jgi:hypothetical protein